MFINNLLFKSLTYFSKIIPIKSICLFNNEIAFIIKLKNLKFVMFFLKNNTFSQYKSLSSISGVDYVYNKYRFESVIEENVDCNDCKDRLVKVSESLGIEIWEHAQPVLWKEAEYQGKKVQLGKVTRGGTKKFQVYVKDGDNVKKVSFGDTSGLSIKTKDPERRKSFKARHKCDQKKDKTSAGYWSCRMWSGPDSVKNMLSK